MDTINITTKEQLDIIMNSQRQKLLRLLEISSTPFTPKELSVELGISPSSVQHHLKKLESLGLVYIHHTETIRGIVARYYTSSKVVIHVGIGQSDDLKNERELLLKNKVSTVLSETLSNMNQKKAVKKEAVKKEAMNKEADVLTGIAHLSSQKADELQQLIKKFMEQYGTPSEDTNPWEYVIIYNRVGSVENE